MDDKPQILQQTPQGPTSGVYPIQGVWPEMERQASEENDIKARALLDLKKEIQAELVQLKKEEGDFKDLLGEYQKGLRRTELFLITITLVVVVAFVTTISLVFFDLIKEKDLYLKYDDVYKNYSDQSSDSKIQINNLENEIQLLKAKNSYLK